MRPTSHAGARRSSAIRSSARCCRSTLSRVAGCRKARCCGRSVPRSAATRASTASLLAWARERLATFDAAMAELGASLGRIAATRVPIEDAGRAGKRKQDAQRALVDALDAEVRASTGRLLLLHRLEGSAGREILERVATQFDSRERVDEGRAAWLSAVSSFGRCALAGLKADIATGGLTLGGGLLAGGLLGALGGGRAGARLERRPRHRRGPRRLGRRRARPARRRRAAALPGGRALRPRPRRMAVRYATRRRRTGATSSSPRRSCRSAPRSGALWRGRSAPASTTTPARPSGSRRRSRWRASAAAARTALEIARYRGRAGRRSRCVTARLCSRPSTRRRRRWTCLPACGSRRAPTGSRTGACTRPSAASRRPSSTRRAPASSRAWRRR